MTVVLILVVIAAFIAIAVTALKWYVVTAAILLYIEGKGYTLPTADEVEACTKAAIKHMVRDYMS